MSDEITHTMIAAYNQQASPTMFLSGLFNSSPQNFYNTEEIELDIIRGREDVSIVIQDLSTGYRENAVDIATNKSFKAPIHQEAAALNSWDLLKREFGEHPFASVDFRANLMARVFRGTVALDAKINRAKELQASQILQTGIVTLEDKAANTLYSLNFGPKATHFPTAGTAWDAAGDVAGDLLSLANVIRTDGLTTPDQLIFGQGAWEAAITNAVFRSRFDIRRMDLGTVAPQPVRSDGGTFMGRVIIGAYSFDCWTYDGRFIDPATDISVPFVEDGTVIMRASTADMRATFGGIPNIGRELGVGQNILPEMPGRLPNTAGGADLVPNVWLSNDGTQLFYGVGSRPLYLPVAIDTYGAIDGTVT